MVCNLPKPVLTVWESITARYKPDDVSTSPTARRSCAKSKALYIP